MTLYHDKFKELMEKDSFKAQQWFGQRKELVEEYSWAIPNDEAVEYLAQFGAIQEMGAGNGYWAYEVEKAGGEVFAYDIEPPDDTWSDVFHGTPSRIFKDIPLLLVWPPYDDGMASHALRYHKKAGGVDVFYVGEKWGCTAHDNFHDTLETEYALVKTIDIPSYVGIHDMFYHYKYKL